MITVSPTSHPAVPPRQSRTSRTPAAEADPQSTLVLRPTIEKIPVFVRMFGDLIMSRTGTPRGQHRNRRTGLRTAMI